MSCRESPRVCVIGGDGAIGAALLRRLHSDGVAAVASTRRAAPDASDRFRLDLADDLHGFRLPDCDVLVLAAAMTRLADCRENPEAARRINVEAPVALAQMGIHRGAFVIFLSTNQVFDGSRAGVSCDEPTNPRSAYGAMKSEAENRLRALNRDVAIVRLSKVIGRHLGLFEDWRKRLSADEPIDAFVDLVMAPIAIDKVVAGLEAIGLQRAGGIWHLGGREDISYYEAARHLARRLGAPPALVRAASATEKGIPAVERPPHTALHPGSIDALTGVVIDDAFAELDKGLELEDRSPPRNR